MADALQRHMPEGTEWQRPQGGMFFWLRLPAGCDALALLPQAVAAGIAYVPGAAFYAHTANNPADPRTLRLSFVTLSPDDIATGVATLGRVLRSHTDGSRERAP
jgi:2-aminoadipate transaminase